MPMQKHDRTGSVQRFQKYSAIVGSDTLSKYVPQMHQVLQKLPQARPGRFDKFFMHVV